MRPATRVFPAIALAVLSMLASADDSPRIGDDGRPSLEHLENALIRAGIQRNTRRLDEAVAGLDELVRLDDTNARAKVVLARGLLRQSGPLNRQRAVRLVDEALERDPQLVEAYSLRVGMGVDAFCLPCADEALARARAIDAQAASVHAAAAYIDWSALARTMREPGAAAERERRMRDLLARTDQSLRAAVEAERNAIAQSGYLQWQADFLRFAGRNADADQALQRAARIDPDDWSPKLRYATAIAATRGRLVEAADLIESAGGPRDERTQDIVAAAAYARWAKAYRARPRASESARLLADARKEHPGVEAVFQHVSAYESTVDVAEAMLDAGVYRVQRAEYRDRDGDTALANLILNFGYVAGNESRTLPKPGQAMADRLLGQGANPNAWASRTREPVVSVAARMGDAWLVDRLLRAGASVHERGAEGGTPIAAATQAADPKVALELVQRMAGKGASTDARADNGTTVLMAAAEAGHDEVVAWLLVRGADPHRVDHEGANVLDRAAAAGNQALVERLLKAGVAQTRIVGTCGVITTQARARHHPAIVALLKQYEKRAI